MEWLDPAIVGIFIISIMTGFLRGFVKEFLSCITWSVAFIVASMFASGLAAAFSGVSSMGSTGIGIGGSNEAIANVYAQQATDMSGLSTGIAFTSLFFSVIMIGAMLNYYIADMVKEEPGFLSRACGSICGLWRGFLFVILVLFLINLTPFASDPWVTDSTYATSFKPFVNVVSEQVQPGLSKSRVKAAPPRSTNLMQGIGGG